MMNAIILAAGLGNRLRPLTENTPKPLVKINGNPIIETQIKYLKKIGVKEIIVITGYLHEKFNYLKYKYDIKLVHNDKYDIYNNGYSLYLVRKCLKNTLVLEGDVFIKNNFLTSNLEKSTYFSGVKEDCEKEWILKFDSNNNIVDIKIGDGTDYIMTGISYWNYQDGKKLKILLEDMVKEDRCENLFWDDLVKENLDDFDINIHKIGSDDWVEVDSIEDFKRAEMVKSKI